MNRICNIHLRGKIVASLVFIVMVWPVLATGQDKIEYRVLRGGKSIDLEQAMNEAAAEGFRFTAALDRFAGGIKSEFSSMRGRRVVVLQKKRGHVPEMMFRYRVFDASRLSTLQEELDKAGTDGFVLIKLVPNSNARSLLAVLERRITEP